MLTDRSSPGFWAELFPSLATWKPWAGCARDWIWHFTYAKHELCWPQAMLSFSFLCYNRKKTAFSPGTKYYPWRALNIAWSLLVLLPAAAQEAGEQKPMCYFCPAQCSWSDVDGTSSLSSTEWGLLCRTARQKAKETLKAAITPGSILLSMFIPKEMKTSHKWTF